VNAFRPLEYYGGLRMGEGNLTGEFAGAYGFPRQARAEKGGMPREKLLSCGAGRLSDAELVAAILGSGTREKNVFRLAEEVLSVVECRWGGIDPKVFFAMSGLGPAKACALSAALELGRRIFRPGDAKIAFPRDVFPIVSHYADRKQERFVVISLNGAHEVIAVRVVSVGLVNRTLIHPREVFADPLVDRAAGIVVAHNHPSGRLEPSSEDREITDRLKKAGDTLGIIVLDHVIFSPQGYYSFLEAGNF
jgi:DNA repair protein RadC